MREQNSVTDRDLLNSLYRSKMPLAVRVEIHRRYTVPPVDFVQWVLGLIPWEGVERVADIGCGTGNYVEPVAERLSPSARHVLGDVSLEMLHDLGHSSNPPAVNLNAASLPFADASCDIVLANHVLHHVSDVDQALAECQRVLRENGRLLAATNGRSTMAELSALIREGYDRLAIPLTALPANPFGNFTLETGQAILSRWLAQVERHVLHSTLVFPEPTPLVAYVDSMRGLYKPGLPHGVSWDDLVEVWHNLIADHIARHGEFRISKISGAFVAVKHHPG